LLESPERTLQQPKARQNERSNTRLESNQARPILTHPCPPTHTAFTHRSTRSNEARGDGSHGLGGSLGLDGEERARYVDNLRAPRDASRHRIERETAERGGCVSSKDRKRGVEYTVRQGLNHLCRGPGGLCGLEERYGHAGARGRCYVPHDGPSQGHRGKGPSPPEVFTLLDISAYLVCFRCVWPGSVLGQGQQGEGACVFSPMAHQNSGESRQGRGLVW
jgi:hypothetical protein